MSIGFTASGGGGRPKKTWVDYLAGVNTPGLTAGNPSDATGRNLMSTALGAEANVMSGAAPATNLGNTGVNPGTGLTAPTGADAQANANDFYADNPRNAVNLIMQQMGRSVSNNSPMFQNMMQIAPGMEWLSLFANGGQNQALNFQGNVNDFMQGGIGTLGGGPFGGWGGLTDTMRNLAGGGNTAELGAIIDNMTPEEIVQAMGSMIETAGFGSQSSRLTEALQSAALDEYNKWAGQAGNIQGTLGDGETIADAFLKFMGDTGLFDKFW
jgi:hypothetical protein